MQSSPQTLTTHKIGSSKLVLAFLAAAATAIIGTAGVAGAQTMPANGYGGYAGDVNANVNVNLNVNGDNNTINIIIRYVLGG